MKKDEIADGTVAEVKISDLKKAYEEGCDDVRKVLQNMYPEIFKGKWVDVSNEINVQQGYTKDGSGLVHIKISHNNTTIGYFGVNGFRPRVHTPLPNYKIAPAHDFHFQVFKKQ